MYLPNRLELLFRTVRQLPKLSISGLLSFSFSSMRPTASEDVSINDRRRV
jgi:hypothetical protein